MRVLVTGASGQLGQDLALRCAMSGDEVTALSRRQLDVSHERDVTNMITSMRPEVVVNCAAWTGVDACEDDPARANRINGEAVGFLAQACAGVAAHLVQISTDYVFSGQQPGSYSESDETDPQSVYGRSKRLGEELAGSNATVVRTSWVCSAHGGNMVATIMRLAAHHDVLRFVDDQRGRPTFTRDLARAIRHLAAERTSGLFHVANQGSVSWYEFARQVFVAAGHDPDRIEPISTDELQPPRPAARPANSVLATEKYDQLGHGGLPHFADTLDSVVAAYL